MLRGECLSVLNTTHPSSPKRSEEDIVCHSDMCVSQSTQPLARKSSHQSWNHMESPPRHALRHTSGWCPGPFQPLGSLRPTELNRFTGSCSAGTVPTQRRSMPPANHDGRRWVKHVTSLARTRADDPNWPRFLQWVGRPRFGSHPWNQ